MTPPPAATAPGACAPPALGTATTTTLRVSWQAVDDDGGAEPLRYDVEMARVNAKKPDAPLSFDSIYAGYGTWAITVESLDEETEYVFRACATNLKGRGAWSTHTHGSTLQVAGEGALRRTTHVIPQAWMRLEDGMQVSRLYKYSPVPAHTRSACRPGLTSLTPWMFTGRLPRAQEEEEGQPSALVGRARALAREACVIDQSTYGTPHVYTLRLPLLLSLAHVPCPALASLHGTFTC